MTPAHAPVTLPDSERVVPSLSVSGGPSPHNQRQSANGIGQLGESSLHAALKAWLWQPGDMTEVDVDGYVVDLVHGEQLIEIQTSGFGKLRPKLLKFLPQRPVCIVYPIPAERWIVTLDSTGKEVLRRRRSPKHGQPLDLFDELFRLGDLVPHPHLSLRLVLTQEEQIRCDDGRGSWRRKGVSIIDRCLLQVLDTCELASPDDLLALLPADLSRPFTNRMLAKQAHVRLRLAQRISLTLRKAGALSQVGKEGRQMLFDVPTS